MLLSDLLKRKEYNYPDEINFDSLSNQHQLNYPVNKFFVSENVDICKLNEQIKNHAVDFRFKSIKNLYLIFLSFHCKDDYEKFDNEINFHKCFHIDDSKDIQHILT